MTSHSYPLRKLLLLSNSTQHGSAILEYCSDIVRDYFTRNGVSKVLFIPYAKKDHAAYTRKVQPAFEKMGLEVESITDQPDAVAAAKTAQAYFIGGGNTFLLLRSLQDAGLVPVIVERVLKEGVPYMGASAGTNVATVNICTTNDMPIIQPASFSALGLVPFNINPHYVDPDPSSTHMGETREQRIQEYHEVSDNPPVLGLREGCMLSVEGDHAKLMGSRGAKLFIREGDQKELAPGDDISPLLRLQSL